MYCFVRLGVLRSQDNQRSEVSVNKMNLKLFPVACGPFTGQMQPATDIVTLEDYRLRYKLYLTDPDFVRARQGVPVISIADDHEGVCICGAQSH